MEGLPHNRLLASLMNENWEVENISFQNGYKKIKMIKKLFLCKCKEINGGLGFGLNIKLGECEGYYFVR